MTKLYIDIETIPSQQAWVKEEIAESIKHPGNIKKQETLDKWNEESKPAAVEEEWRKTGLDGTFGEIICIGYAFDDDPVAVLGRELGSGEEGILNAFQRILSIAKAPIYVGHNIAGFDLRFIWQRCVINDVYTSIPHDCKPWDSRIFDTLYQWKGTQISGGRLDRVCKALGFDGKGDMDGSKVWDAIEAGEYEKVFAYCKDDVEKVRQLHKRMTFGG